jgi:hypothetical protein
MLENAKEIFEPKEMMELMGVEDKILLWTLKALPWAILPFSLLALLERDPMLASGLLASALSLFAFEILMRQINYTLGSLWKRNIIRDRYGSEDKLDNNRLPEYPTRSPELESKYQKFIRECLKATSITQASGPWAYPSCYWFILAG